MAEHAPERVIPAGRPARLCAVAIMAAALAGCGSLTFDSAGFLVHPDLYEANTCKEIFLRHASVKSKEKDLLGLIEKAETAPGGGVISTAVYASDLAYTRADLRTLVRTANAKKCEGTLPP